MNQLDLYNYWTLPLRIQRKLWPFSLEKCTPDLPYKVLRVPKTPYASQAPPPSCCMAPCSVQVLDKHGDIYGRERIAELLGMDLASLEITVHHERKPEPPPGLLTWCAWDSTTHAWGSRGLARVGLSGIWPSLFSPLPA